MLAGVVVAMLVITLVETLDGFLFPLPAIDWTDPAAVSRMMMTVPRAAQVLVVAGWLLGALAGAVLAVRVARLAWTGWIPAGAVVVGGIWNVLAIAHPWWMNVGAVLAPLAGGALGIALARRRAD